MTTLPESCPELGTEVSISAIDKELRKLWEQDEARTNASLMNFAVYSENPDALAQNSAIIRDLTREHACRAILIGINRAIQEPTVRAWITAHCHLAHGLKSVCCEQIAFYLTGRVTGRFRNTVFAHLNSDLPLIFWWQGELTDVFSERLVSVIDRLIVDSSSWADPESSFATIEEASQANDDMILQDLAWTRTWQFRLGVAALFDDQVAAQGLPSIQNVEIVHHPKNRNSALQLLAWLAIQARWSDGSELALNADRSANGSESFAFESKGGVTITATLRADESAAALAKLELSGPELTLRVTREADSNHVVRQVEAPGHTATSMSPADPAASADLVVHQLARGGKNSLYKKILPRFRAMLQR